MLTTQKYIFQHETAFAFPKNPVLLNNSSLNEIYLQIQPPKVTLTSSESAAAVAELSASGYLVSTPNFASGFSVKIEKGSEVKTLIQTITTSTGTETVVYLLWEVPVI